MVEKFLTSKIKFDD